MYRKIILSCALFFVSLPTMADSPYTKNWYLDLGAYWTNIDSNIGLKGDHLAVKRFDVENIVGLEDSSTEPYVQAMYRFNDRHALEFSYIDLDREGKQVLSIKLSPEGDPSYDIGTRVKSKFQVQTFRLGYRYALFTDKNKNLEIGAGLHITKFDFKIQAVAGANGEAVIGTKSDTGITAPLPAIGLKGAYRFGNDILIKGNVDFFMITIDNYAGNLINSGAYVEYDAFKHMGLGAGYQYNRIDLEVDSDGLSGDADYTYHGPVAYVSLFY